MEGVGRYSGKSNYLTFALQLLTGRMHAQQTIYNPQASPIVRGIVGGGNKYQWQPGKGGKLEQNWTEGMSKHLFEDPKVTDEEGRKVESSFKKKYGMGRPTSERIRIFKEFEKQAEQNPGAGLYNQYVQWGNELIERTAGFNTREAGALLTAFKKAASPQQANEVKKQIAQRYGSDPLSPRLKAYLADFETDAIHQADYLMALAKYERAKKNGTIFTDTQAFEIDGQTHGPATLATLLGSLNMAKRSGIIMKTPFLEKLESSDYKDVRDAMADEMKRKFPSLIKGVTKVTHDSKAGLPSIANAYERILEEAIGDRENFLKKSPMTMGYGQDIFSLKQHVDRTVFLNDEIKSIMANHKLSNDDVIDFLHTILVDSIYETMDPQTLRMTKLMKAIAFMSPLSAELLQIKQPTGLVSTLAGLTSEQAGQTQYQIKDEAGKPRTVTVQHYNVKTDPSAIKPMPGKAPEFGGYAVGRAQPSIIQAFDSNMVTKTFTNSWDKIKEIAKSLGAANPFVLQIYDAFLTDSGTMDVVRRSANEHHKNSLINEQAIEKLFDWYESTFTEKLNTLKNDTTTYELFKDGVVNKESEFKTIAGLLANPDRFTNGSRKTFVKLIQRQGDFQWERADNINIKGDTLEEWNKKTFNAAKKMALELESNINKKLKVNKKSLLDKSFTGQEIGIILEEIIRTLEMPARIKEGRQLVTQSRGELAREIGSQDTLNIDL